MLDNERAKASRQFDENARLETRVSEYQHHLEGREAELKHTARQLGDLQASYQKLEQTSEDTMKGMATKHAKEVQVATERAGKELQALNVHLETARQDCQRELDDHDRTRTEVQRLHASIPPLESKLQEFEDFCNAQEKELNKLRTYQRNILNLQAGVGSSPQKPLAIRPASRPYRENVEPQLTREPRSHRRRKSAVNAHGDAPGAAMATQEITNAATDDLANASFASSGSYSSQGGGPSPKRPKPRSSFRVPTMQTPYTQKPNMKSKSASSKLSPGKRSALRQMSPNRRHTVGFASTEAEEDDRAMDIRPVSKRRGKHGPCTN